MILFLDLLTLQSLTNLVNQISFLTHQNFPNQMVFANLRFSQINRFYKFRRLFSIFGFFKIKWFYFISIILRFFFFFFFILPLLLKQQVLLTLQSFQRFCFSRSSIFSKSKVFTFSPVFSKSKDFTEAVYLSSYYYFTK